MSAIRRVSEFTLRLLAAPVGEIFKVPRAKDVPISTCKRYGVTIKVSRVRGEDFKYVYKV